MDVYHLPPPEEMDRDDALRFARDWLNAHRGQKRLVIVPGRRNVGNSPVLIQIAAQIQTETAQTFRNRAGNLREAAVAVVWPSKETLHRVQERRPAKMLIVPWRVEESQAWLEAHSSTPLAGGRNLDTPSISDPVVLEAMKSLTSFVNLGNDLISYDDRDYAIQILRALVTARRHVNPDELYGWALANDWEGKGAETLRVLATEILDGKRHRIHASSPSLGRDAISWWTQEAENQEPAVPPPS